MRQAHARFELVLTSTSIAFTLCACLFLTSGFITTLAAHVQAEKIRSVAEQICFIAIVFFMLYGNLVYQFARLGHFKRLRTHQPAKRSELENLFEASAPALVILVPSYREEARRVEQTLLAAALQDYPNRRVVLLIDDPPNSGDREARASLEAARDLPRKIQMLFDKPGIRFGSALDDFRERRRLAVIDLREETLRLAQLYAEAGSWLEAQAANYPERDHTDRLFVELVLRSPARAHLERTFEFERRATTGQVLNERQLLGEYQRLSSLFRVEITSFERKRYLNLSHVPNKAMNLNSYIGLLGGNFREITYDDGLHLEPTVAPQADLSVPPADYVATLDADSLISSDYSLRLVHLMTQPGNERLAVAQTPYSAVPGPAGLLERIAGATTDIQHIIHQGFAQHDSAYWVGANALLRKSSLDDLRSVTRERGFEIPVFIQDRTVIEDTESSVDLISKGWSLHNYPARLAYSATPPDFGALLIQRRRWANGGLIILPKLLRYILRGNWSCRKLMEALMRCHYLTSIAGVNLGLLLLLLYPFEHAMRELWLPIATLPYFLLYARDLGQIGYPTRDAIRAYALNLMLLPVNLGGVLNSLHQAVTGKKSPFARTPKVKNRTAAPAIYILAQYALIIALMGLIGMDIARERWFHALFGLVNGVLLAYAVSRYIGIGASIEDLLIYFRPNEKTDRHVHEPATNQ